MPGNDTFLLRALRGLSYDTTAISKGKPRQGTYHGFFAHNEGLWLYPPAFTRLGESSERRVEKVAVNHEA